MWSALIGAGGSVALAAASLGISPRELLLAVADDASRVVRLTLAHESRGAAADRPSHGGDRPSYGGESGPLPIFDLLREDEDDDGATAR